MPESRETPCTYSNLINEFRQMKGLLYLQKNVRETPPTTKCTWPNVRINFALQSKAKVWLFDLFMLFIQEM